MITERVPWRGIRPPVNCYIIAGENGLMFDAGYGARSAVRSFVRAFRRVEEICRGRHEPFCVRRIMLSHAHPDHFAGLRGLREELELQIILTSRQAAIIAGRESYRRAYNASSWERDLLGKARFSGRSGRLARSLISAAYETLFGTRFVSDPDVIIPERCEIEVNGEPWQVFPSPGHSDDHISLYHPSKGILFAGDNILERIITWLGPPRSDMKDYLASLDEILALPKLELILGSHGPPVTRPHRRIGSIILWRKKRMNDVLQAIRRAGSAGVTAKDIVTAMYRGPARKMLGEGWILLALKRLLEQGLVRRVEKSGKVIFLSDFSDEESVSERNMNDIITGGSS